LLYLCLSVFICGLILILLSEEFSIRSDKFFVSPLLRKAEEILEIAMAGENGALESAIVVDRQGGFRMMDPAGWSLSGLAAEFGAAAVYKIDRRGDSVRVEGWDGVDRCLLQRPRKSPWHTPVDKMRPCGWLQLC